MTAVFTADWIVSDQFGEMSTRADRASAVHTLTCLCQCSNYMAWPTKYGPYHT